MLRSRRIFCSIFSPRIAIDHYWLQPLSSYAILGEIIDRYTGQSDWMVWEMSVCTFFGHRDCPASLKPKLRAVVVDLIEQHGVDRFYVGRQGSFDAMTRAVLRELAEVYPHISYAVVLERLPGQKDEAVWDFSDTIFPEGLEIVPPRFAIARRNEWMLR